MSITVTNVDLGSVELDGASFTDGAFEFSAAGEYPEGLILARNDNDRFVPYDPEDTENGLNVPRAVLTYTVTATATGASNIPGRALIGGRVREERLLVGEDAPDVADLDALRQTGIIPVSVEQLGRLDNQS